jgi:hypothetical protein
MSQPKYMKKEDSGVSILPKVDTLVEHIFRITGSDKQFPKVYRYNLVTIYRNTALQLQCDVHKAVAIKPKYKKMNKKKMKLEDRIYDEIMDMITISATANRVAKLRNPEYIATLLDDILDAYLRWIKNDRRKYRNLPSKKKYQKEMRKNTEKHRREHEEWASLNPFRDEDGFVVLKRK